MPDPQPTRRLRYEIVTEMILGIITDQRMQPGDRLPSSTELATLSGFSLISVRRALDDLERAGRVLRQQGVGTFVARQRIISEPARSGELMDTFAAESAGDLMTELVSIKVGLPSATIAAGLRISEGQPVWEVVRRRLLDARPVIVETAVLPLQLVPALDEEWLRQGKSLYGFLADQHGLLDHHEEQLLAVVVPTVAERNLLKLPGREQVVRIRAVSFTEDGTPFDCFQQTYPSRQFVFYVSGSRERRLLPTTDGDDWGVAPLPGQ